MMCQIFMQQQQQHTCSQALLELLKKEHFLLFLFYIQSLIFTLPPKFNLFNFQQVLKKIVQACF